ncbi:MAG: D-glycerate dehydrogenase [Anaerolineaceae bacterium]|nr:D-glycerate dehydrogenase [Anaerolineaceae bacterium]
MPKPKVFVTRKINPSAIEKLQSIADAEIWPNENPPPKEILLEKFAATQAVLTMLTDSVDHEVINRAPSNFKIISQMAVGTDNIDVTSATKRKIPIGHTPDVLTESCADFTWALITAIARRVSESHQEVRQGIWLPWGPDVLLGADLFGATLGIIGLGRIGLAVARRALGFNMKVLYFSKTRKPDLETKYNLQYRSMEELLSISDFVSLHVNLNQSTHHLINTDTIKFMKKSAYLINIARGKIIDPKALTQAIHNKQIAGAALDVFDPEPIQQNHPLLSCPNVIITPHIASASIPVRKKMAEMAVENILFALQNNPIPYCVNPIVYQ